ncbi:MAG: hypothetical protein KAQ98_03030 [Bacteriovoracaceae bacterium]|nr:hypothetical protein [Bacteriovoracaceae bacterium]
MHIAPLKINIDQMPQEVAPHAGQVGTDVFLEMLQSQSASSGKSQEMIKAQKILAENGLLGQTTPKSAEKPITELTAEQVKGHNDGLVQILEQVHDGKDGHKNPEVKKSNGHDILQLLSSKKSPQKIVATNEHQKVDNNEVVHEMMWKKKNQVLPKGNQVSHSFNRIQEETAKNAGFNPVRKNIEKNPPVFSNKRKPFFLGNGKVSIAKNYSDNKPADNLIRINFNKDESKKQQSLEKNLFETRPIQSNENFKTDEMPFLVRGGHLENGPVVVQKSDASQQVLNLENLNTVNTEKIIEQISSYISENSIKNKDSLDLVVKHRELGQFELNISKLRNMDNLNIEIRTITDKGHDFFVKNEHNLIKTLQNSGLRVGDFKITTSNEFFNMNQDNNSSSKEYSSSSRSSQNFYGSDDHQGNDDSRRRKMLWEMFKERYQA